MRNLIRHKRERPQGKCFGTSAAPLLHNKYAKEGAKKQRRSREEAEKEAAEQEAAAEEAMATKRRQREQRK